MGIWNWVVIISILQVGPLLRPDGATTKTCNTAEAGSAESRSGVE